MTCSTEALVPTDEAKKYAAQLGKHWSHNLTVTEHGDDVHIIFPKDARGADWPDDALLILSPQRDGLACTIKASSEAQRDGLKEAVARHVDRVAFREAPLAYNWQDADH